LGAEALEALGERFPVLLAQGLSGLLGRTVISPRPGSAIRSIYSAFVASTDDADFCFLLRAPLNSQPVVAFIELPPHLAYAFVDILLGGRDQQVFVPARPLTQAERPLLAEVLEQAAAALIACLGAATPRPCVAPVQGQMPVCVDQIAADQPVVAAVFDLVVGQHEGAIRLCVPSGPLVSADQNSNLSTSSGPLELTICLETTLLRSDLEHLAPGDVIATDVPTTSQLVVRAGGIPKYVGKLASSDGHRAVAISGNYAAKSGQ
jgi:flagellar motor switch protein FliM